MRKRFVPKTSTFNFNGQVYDCPEFERLVKRYIKSGTRERKKRRRRERKSFAITSLDVFILKVNNRALEFVFEFDVFAIRKDALLKSCIVSKLSIRQRNSKYGINEREREIRGIFELKIRSRY